MREFLVKLLSASAMVVAFGAIVVWHPFVSESRTMTNVPSKVAVATRVSQPKIEKSTEARSQDATLSSEKIASLPIPTPTPIPTPVPVLPNTSKHIIVTLKTQTLQYFEGDRLIGEFKISSGIRGMPTPTGEFTVLAKKPVVHYKGETYNFPNTKWNLMFKANVPLNYYIHGAYWHNNFGHPMSHGCVNVSYVNMEPLYNWAEVGTRITIQ